MEHLEKDIKKMWHHKDVIILVLVIALVVVTILAILLAIKVERYEWIMGYEMGGMGNGPRPMMNMDDNFDLTKDPEFMNSNPIPLPPIKVTASTTKN